jgi:hypothetical protein
VAHVAVFYAVAHVYDGVAKRIGVFLVLTQKVQCQAQRRFASYAGQTRQLIYRII